VHAQGELSRHLENLQREPSSPSACRDHVVCGRVHAQGELSRHLENLQREPSSPSACRSLVATSAPCIKKARLAALKHTIDRHPPAEPRLPGEELPQEFNGDPFDG
jgi:hypothetical protein